MTLRGGGVISKRTPEYSVTAKFAEILFHALR
jgi:hypothetical protein